MKLVCRDRRSLEHRKSCVGKYPLLRFSSCPVFACHIAVVRGGIPPGIAVPFVVRAHAVEAVAARQFPFEMKDV